MERSGQLERLRQTRHWDLVVIGGGATGLGVALEASARGLKVALLEGEDFAKGTSSRATKIVHGGVRYLAQGHIALVREALRERATLLASAPHLAQPLAFVLPARRWWQPAFYAMGLKLYDALAGQRSLGATRMLSSAQTLSCLPNLQSRGLHGGVRYWDGQFDDARLALALARSAAAHGAVVLNHCPATALLHEGGKVQGVAARDAETGEAFTLHSRAVVNATGVWVDAVRAMDGHEPRQPLVTPSQGAHVVVARAFLPGRDALIVPQTSDGRVLFAIPWLGKTLLGTTDGPRRDVPLEPVPTPEEIGFILREAAQYLARAPGPQDVLSAWAGLRPLLKPPADAGSTGKISREHTVLVEKSGLVTVTGGKWTTSLAMARDVLRRCAQAHLLPPGGEENAPTALRLIAAPQQAAGHLALPPGEHLYGSEVGVLRALPGADCWLWRDGQGDEAGGLSEAMLRFAVRFEAARTVEDLLARRSRLLFLDAARAEALARPAAAVLAEELGRPVPEDEILAFEALARRYRGV